MPKVVFRAPEARDEAAVVAAQSTMAGEGFVFAPGYWPDAEFASWLQRVADRRIGKSLTPGQVPSTFELAVIGDQVVGRLSVRHALSDSLMQKGGHIGYGVLPHFRRQGIGRQMLYRGLEITTSLGINRALVTCDENNDASRRIIESAGGCYESSYAGDTDSVPARRYWIG
jgi:predicted acetyltransferase